MPDYRLQKTTTTKKHKKQQILIRSILCSDLYVQRRLKLVFTYFCIVIVLSCVVWCSISVVLYCVELGCIRLF